MEGRDIGLSFFPKAELQSFLDAFAECERNACWKEPMTMRTAQQRKFRRSDRARQAAIASVKFSFLLRWCAPADAVAGGQHGKWGSKRLRGADFDSRRENAQRRFAEVRDFNRDAHGSEILAFFRGRAPLVIASAAVS